MSKNTSSNSPIQDSQTLEALLADSEPYIRALVCRRMPRGIVHPDVLDLEIDEIVQNVLIKLWMTLQKQTIMNVRAYLRVMVRSEIVNMVRRTRPYCPLSVDEDGAVFEGEVLLSTGEGTTDPAYEVEQEESLTNSLTQTVDAVLALPSCQQRAVICSLKDRMDNVLLLIETFRAHQVDIEQVNWPEEKDERQKCRISLSIARKKLRTSLYPHIVA